MQIPSIGLGTYQMTERDVRNALPFAIKECKYRLIDTAAGYKNEQFIGNEITNLIGEGAIIGLLAIGTKDHGFEMAVNAVKNSIERLKTPFIDLYLIHWPAKAGLSPTDPQNKKLRKESWQALEQCCRLGLIKHIGISNYTLEHLKELLEYAIIKPYLHQFELHPLYFPEDVVTFCQENGIIVQAYSSLGEGELLKKDFLLAHPAIEATASEYGKSPAQVLLKWALQHDFYIIPKSIHHERIKQNISLEDFSLTKQQMAAIDGIHRKETKKFCWDPTAVQ